MKLNPEPWQEKLPLAPLRAGWIIFCLLVTFFAERKKTTEIKTENRVASGTSRRVNSSRITVQAQAYIANVSKIGSWYSKDGKLFFIAIGCFLPR